MKMIEAHGFIGINEHYGIGECSPECLRRHRFQAGSFEEHYENFKERIREIARERYGIELPI